MLRLSCRILYCACLLAMAFALPVDDANAKVNRVTGDYSEQHIDLSVQAPGGEISVLRYYLRGRTGFNDQWEPLDLGTPDNTGLIRSMLRDGNTFTNLSVLPDLYVKDENETISRTATGYHWKDRASGDWVDYDASGRFTASGHLNITVAHSLYDPYGKLTGILDARGRQVLWYSYSGNNISSVHDAANRSVSYQYDAAGRITTFTDVLGHAWHYQYNAKGYLVKRTDPLGRTLNITYAADGKTASVKDQDGIGASYQFSFDSKTREYYMKEASSGQVRMPRVRLP